MGGLRSLRVEFSTDEFCNSYSPLSYLHRMPFSFLEVDRSFIGLMKENAENFEIITIIKLTKSL